MKTNPDDANFLAAIKGLKVGDTLTVDDGVLEVESKHQRPTHFVWHQRIFPAGMILKKQGSNLRIFVEAEKIKLKKDVVAKGVFDDKQIKEDGEVLKPDHSVARQKFLDSKKR
jgi:hypothetical protein